MAQEIAAAYVTLLPTASGMTRGIEKEMGGVWDGAEKRGTRAFGSVFTAAAKLATAAAVTIGGVFGASKIFGGGMARLMGIEEAQAKLRGLGNDAETVEVIMGNALASVRGTSFGMAEAATTAAGAVAAGIQPGEDLERMLKSVANSAAAAGVDMGEMGAIFNKVATVDMAQMDVLNQVSDRGIPIIQALADVLGVTTEEVRKMASAGQIGFAEFEEAMTKASGTVADEMGGTLRGSIANMNAALGRIGANFLEGVYPKLAPAIQSLTEWLGGVEEAAKTAGQWLGDTFESGIEKWEAFSRGLEGTMGWDDVSNRWAELGKAIRLNFLDPLQTVQESWEAFWAGLTGTMTWDHVDNAWAEFGKSIRFWASDIGAAYEEAGGGLDGILAAIQAAFDSAGEWVSSEGVQGIVEKLLEGREELVAGALELFMGIATALPEILPEVVNVLTGTVLPGILSALEWMLPEIIETAVTLFLGLVDGLIIALPAIIDAVVLAIPQIVTAITDSLPVLIEGAITLFLGLIDGLIIALPEILTAVINAVPEIVEALITALPVLIEGAITLFLGIIEGLEEASPEIAQAAADLVPVIIDAMLELDGLMREGGEEIIAAIMVGMATKTPSLMTLTTNFSLQMVDSLLERLPDLRDVGQRWMTKLFEGVGLEWPKIQTWFRELPGRIMLAMGSLGTRLYSSGKALIDGFADGMRDAFPRASRIASVGLAGLRALFPFSPAKEGPFSGLGYTTHSGRALIRDFADAIRGESPTARDAARSVLGGMDVLGGLAPVGIETGGSALTVWDLLDALRQITLNIDGRQLEAHWGFDNLDVRAHASGGGF